MESYCEKILYDEGEPFCVCLSPKPLSVRVWRERVIMETSSRVSCLSNHQEKVEHIHPSFQLLLFNFLRFKGRNLSFNLIDVCLCRNFIWSRRRCGKFNFLSCSPHHIIHTLFESYIARHIFEDDMRKSGKGKGKVENIPFLKISFCRQQRWTIKAAACYFHPHTHTCDN